MTIFTKNILGLILTCIGFTYANGGERVNPTDISTLNQNLEIAKLARSTIMFGNDNICNGVAIGGSEFITARHCVYDAEGKYPYYKSGDVIEMYAYTDGEFQLQYAKIKSLKYGTQFHYKYFLAGGEDLAIVQLENKPLLQYIPEVKIVQNPKKLNYQTGAAKTLELGQLLWDGSGYIYAITASQIAPYQLQYRKTEVYPNKPSWKLDKYSNFRFLSETNIDYVYYNLNPMYALQGADEHKLNYEKRSIADPFYYNTNVLIHPRNSSAGDSGGPLFICKQNGNTCYLLGVHSYSDASVSGETLLLNPQYDMIRSN